MHPLVAAFTTTDIGMVELLLLHGVDVNYEADQVNLHTIESVGILKFISLLNTITERNF